jgi:hypothetical protein
MDLVNGHYVPRTSQDAQGNSAENDGSIILIQMSRKVAGLQRKIMKFSKAIYNTHPPGPR